MEHPSNRISAEEAQRRIEASRQVVLALGRAMTGKAYAFRTVIIKKAK